MSATPQLPAPAPAGPPTELADLPALTRKQEVLVEEYLRHGNITRAALAAGYSRASAHTLGWRELQKDEVQAQLARRRAELAHATDITVGEIVRELRVIAGSNVGHYRLDAKRGRVTLAPGAPPDAMRAVSSVEHTVRILKDGSEQHKLKLRLWNKNGALTDLARWKKMIQPDQPGAQPITQINVVLVREDRGRRTPPAARATARLAAGG